MVITINPSMKNEATRQHQVCLAETLAGALQAAPQVALDASPTLLDTGSMITDDDVVSDHPRQ